MNSFSISKQPVQILSEISQKHKALRKKKGWTQQEMAERSGVSLGSLKRFETTGQISLESLLKLARTLNRLRDFDLILKVESPENLNRLFTS